MQLTINTYLEDLKETINRTIKVNDTMLLETFCEYILVIMNANPKKEYFISINDDEYLSTNTLQHFEDEKYMKNITLKDLKLSTNDTITIYYDGMYDWNIIIEIINIEEGLYNKEFELITGTGVGIVEKFVSTSVINRYLNPTEENLKRKRFITYLNVFNNYNIHRFNLTEINTKLFDYISILEERNQPKNYILNISLDEYGREIKRKIAVNDNINLNDFCEAVITSMQGNLVHSYIIRINGEYLDNDTMEKHNLNYLDLKEKKKFKLLYDLGDNWQFNITTSKVYKGHQEKSIEVLSGKGYGIVEDCGGPWGLQFIFNGTSEEFEYQDINEFNLEENNKMIENFNN